MNDVPTCLVMSTQWLSRAVALSRFLAVACLACSSAPRPPAQSVTTLPPPVAAAATTPPAEAPKEGGGGIVRLYADVHPRSERVELDVNPDREDFSGRVQIELVLDKGRDDLLISARDPPDLRRDSNDDGDGDDRRPGPRSQDRA